VRRRAIPNAGNLGAFFENDDLDATRLSRLRWRCRRGLLENDLILSRFLDARGERLTEDDAALLMRLLELSDGELWDLLSGRVETEDATLHPLVAMLRGA